MAVAEHLRIVLVFGLRLHFHFHFHILHHEGPTIDYAAVTAAAFASWAGVPGPGEPVLIAAGIFAARHKLDITPVLFWAWMGAHSGGLVGWLVGVIAGRNVVTAPGPLHRHRVKAVKKGEEVFRRFAVVAILLAPPWIAGIHRVRTPVYLITNLVSSIVWAVGIGLGAYYAGPPIVDLVDDAGSAVSIGLGVLVVAVVGGEVIRRRRRRARETEGSGPGDPAPAPEGAGPDRHPAAAPEGAAPDRHPAAAPEGAAPDRHPAAAPEGASPDRHPAAAPEGASPDRHPAAEA